MDFSYIKVLDFPLHQKRERFLPWIRFGVYNPKSPNQTIYPLGLVDSGSDITFITHEIGEQLDYNISKGIKDKVLGVGGGSIDIYYHKVGIILEDKKSKEIYNFTDMIAFTYKNFPSTMPQQTAILGTIGFFRHLNICFKFPLQISISQ